jgi:UDP-N-acetylmuramate dehydrogenase
MLNLHHGIDLHQANTLNLTARTAHYLVLEHESQLQELAQIVQCQPKFMVLGGGSNILLPEYYDGLVIHNKLLGISLEQQDNNYLRVSAKAGVLWDDLVAYCCRHQAYGLENLSLIPGTVGAAPIQNIGAYGVEVKDFIEQVTAFDLSSASIRIFNHQECQFSYRNSFFKYKSRYLVLSVTFKLNRIPKLNLSYGDVAQRLSQFSAPTATDLRNCIITIRQEKLPDPQHLPNVGSFFHNPIVSTQQAQSLAQTWDKLPIFPTQEAQQHKLSAGWLIDNLGLKGYRHGNLGIYAKQALVIVNYNQATQNDVLQFAAIIQHQVFTSYQVQLTIEPIIIL